MFGPGRRTYGSASRGTGLRRAGAAARRPSTGYRGCGIGEKTADALLAQHPAGRRDPRSGKTPRRKCRRPVRAARRHRLHAAAR
jgi:hypothetical protein